LDFQNIMDVVLQKLRDGFKWLGKAALKGKRDPQPDLTFRQPYSMNPSGLYGSVFKDRRGHLLLKICLGAGLVLGMGCIYLSAQKAVQAVEKSREVPLCVRDLAVPIDRNLPVLTELYTWDDQDIIDKTVSENENVYVINSTKRGMEIMRCADTMTVEDMANCYAEGFSNQTLETICVILKNSWWITTNHGSHDNIKLKYSEFTSGSLNAAIEEAMEEQGFKGEGAGVLLSGVDNNGNTYKYGTIDYDGETLYWRVAACPVKDVYGFDSLPDEGCYVGITLDAKPFMDLPSEESES